MKKYLLAFALLAQAAYAQEELTPFNQQGDIDYPAPNTEESYLATRAPMETKIFQYIGAEATGMYFSFNPQLPGTKDNNKNSLLFGGGAYIGMGANFDHLYLGAEASAISSLITTKVTGNRNLEIKQPLIAGIDFIPGYLNQAQNRLFYIRLGAGATLLRFNYILNPAATNTNEIKTNKFTPGIRAGLGVRFLMSDSLSIQTEYIYSQYKDAEVTETATDGSAINYKIKSPKTHQLNLGVAYSF